MNIARIGAPVKELRYKSGTISTCQSFVANKTSLSNKVGIISVRARQTTQMVLTAITGRAQLTSLTSKTLTRGIAVPATSLQICTNKTTIPTSFVYV